MIIPFDYGAVLQGRVVLVTGMGRSGTSILADLIASFENVWYLHEPHIMYFAQAIPVDVFRCVVCEDYLFPMLPGTRRQEYLDYIGEQNPIFLIKTCESIANNDRYAEIFPGCRFINIYRAGPDVVSSTVKKGWYTDEYMKERIVDYVDSAR